MSRTIIINSSHYILGSGNKYVYRLPTTTKFEENSAIGVSSISIYNSTFNIEARRGNNTVNLNWLGTTYIVTFDDGYYSVESINYKIQQFCILNGLYLTSNSGSNIIYFIEIVTNPVRYSIQINLYPIPLDSSLTTLGYSKPSSASWSNTTLAQTPILDITTQPFGNLLGQSFNKYPLTPQTTTQSFLSTQTPIISPVSSYVLTCNMLNSKYSNPSNSFYSFGLKSGLGTLININDNPVYNLISPQYYNQIEITFYDQNFTPLLLHDFDMILTLSIVDNMSNLK